MQEKIVFVIILTLVAVSLVNTPLWAQSKSADEAKPEDKAKTPAREESQEELAKAAQNPIADMLSFPLQNNTGFNYRAKQADFRTLPISSPVIPIHLEQGVESYYPNNIPHRVYRHGPNTSSALGNTQFTGFFSPAKPSKFVWGFGPVFQFPTHTDTYLGSNKWSAGPSAVGLVMEGHWVVGLLAQNIWSFAGPGGKNNPDVNQFLGTAIYQL